MKLSLMALGLCITLFMATDADAKRRAPVTLTADVGASSTTLTIKSDVPLLTYQLRAHGAAGLQVIGEVARTNQAQRDPRLRHYIVRHRGQGLIALTIEVGGPRNPSTHVLAVRVNPPPGQRSPGRVETVEGGERIKVLPGRRR